jgi:beta-carotene 3-hydroxylase
MSTLSGIPVLLAAFAVMEGVAWATHRYLMHGPLWFLHRDHHNPVRGQPLQRNDLFFVFFSAPGIGLLALGAASGWQSWHGWAGAGITLYGFAYFLVHELIIHRRLPKSPRVRARYFVALRRAHAAHHKSLERTGGRCFGMLVVPWRFFRAAWRDK